jgi:acylglycerol lipase
MHAFAEAGLLVFAPDHRGHGRTATVLGDLMSAEAVVSDLHVLRKRMETTLGTKPLFVFGHSMGALLALRYLQTHPGCSGAILNGAALKVPKNIHLLARHVARLLADYLPLLAVQGFFDPERACRDPEIWRQMRADPLRYKGKIRARTGREIMDTIARVRADLSSITLPVLITHGGDDPTVPSTVSQALFETAPSHDKTLHIFDGLRHEVQHEPECADVISTWVSWLSARCPTLVPESTP